MYNPYSLVGKTILITGASSGIGRSVAVECSKLGAKVIITARNEQRLQETLSQMEGDGHNYIACDLSESENVATLVSQLPQIDGFISNAGINTMLPISFINDAEIKKILQVNTVSPMLLLKEIVKKKKLKKNSSIVFTSSMAGVGAAAVGNGIYTASKGAISSFIKVAALELAPRKIRVNAVCPGMTETSMIYDDSLNKEQLEKDMERYPLGRYGDPKDIAWAMIFLLSDASAWITGINLVIDGGLTIR